MEPEEIRHILEQINAMKVGECFDISHMFWRHIPHHPFTGEPGIERLKSKIVGAMYCYRFTINPVTHDLTIHRIEEDGLIHQVDWDRRDFFRNVGTEFEPIYERILTDEEQREDSRRHLQDDAG